MSRNSSRSCVSALWQPAKKPIDTTTSLEYTRNLTLKVIFNFFTLDQSRRHQIMSTLRSNLFIKSTVGRRVGFQASATSVVAVVLSLCSAVCSQTSKSSSSGSNPLVAQTTRAAVATSKTSKTNALSSQPEASREVERLRGEVDELRAEVARLRSLVETAVKSQPTS